ncbi:hypothetical protein GNI_123750 [Gregarina niphandrodes]|uniref:Uncharacterized protein n=1 Tax=Gregarina niphandrodes TaxID=110365 RepID=A0A023B297_GRENI|nr:hypothetical protein GNI_123750 [Gregarina niphandrodes]EZG51718.1 hypothetical protein GNI_123750 [Gregarina niphandrodes]|eukprot:XP_011131931.1 hypothetical protein GNI_123750 [Gregarina niphandrodes]
MRRILKDMFCRREFGSAYEEHPYQLFYCIRTRSPICKFHHPKLRCPFLIWLTLNITDSSKSVLLEEVDSNGYIRDVMYGGVEWSTWLCFLSIIAHSRSVSIYLFNERNKTWFGSGPIQGFQNLYYTIIDHTEACKRLEEVCGALSRPILFNELLKGRLSAVSNTIGGKSLKHSCDDTYLSTDLFIPPCSLKIYNRNLRTKWRSQLNSHNGNQGDNLRRVLFQVVNCLLTKKADRSAMKAIIRSIPGVRPGQAILICENKYYGFFVNYILRVINYNLKGLRSIVQGSRKDMALKNILHPMANGYPNPLLENNNSPLLNDPLLNDPLLNDPLLNDPLLNDPQRNTESPSHLTIFPVASASITIPDKHLQKRPLVNRSRKHLEKPLEKRRMVREQVGYVSYPTWKKILDNRHKSIRIKSRLFPLMLETIGKRRLRMVHKINKGTIRVTISSGLMRDPQIVNLPGAVEIMSHAIPTLVSGGSHQYLNLRNCRESLSTRLFYSMLLRCLQATAMHHQYSTLVCSRKKHQTSLEELVSSLPEVSLSYSYFMITIDLESCFDFVNGFVFNASHRKYPLIPDISE